jgi:hypothetical protein
VDTAAHTMAVLTRGTHVSTVLNQLGRQTVDSVSLDDQLIAPATRDTNIGQLWESVNAYLSNTNSGTTDQYWIAFDQYTVAMARDTFDTWNQIRDRQLWWLRDAFTNTVMDVYPLLSLVTSYLSYAATASKIGYTLTRGVRVSEYLNSLQFTGTTTIGGLLSEHSTEPPEVKEVAAPPKPSTVLRSKLLLGRIVARVSIEASPASYIGALAADGVSASLELVGTTAVRP